MVIVDTSVWIDFFRGRNQALVTQLGVLLDEDQVGLASPVWVELLSGSSRASRKILKRTLSALPRLFPTNRTWERMESWAEKAVNNGERFGIADLLIAAITVDHNASLWSLDEDFERMARLKFLELHSPQENVDTL